VASAAASAWSLAPLPSESICPRVAARSLCGRGTRLSGLRTNVPAVPH
jgi:hypothetical protein